MKKISFVLAITLLFGMFSISFLVGAAAPAIYPHVEYGTAHNVADPASATWTVFSHAGNYAAVDRTSNLGDYTCFVVDIGETRLVNGFVYGANASLTQNYSTEDVVAHFGMTEETKDALSLWYSNDNRTFTKMDGVTYKAVSGPYVMPNENKPESSRDYYTIDFKASFPEVEARYVMLAVYVSPEGLDPSSPLIMLHRSEENMYLLHEEVAPEEDNSDTADALSVVTFVALVSATGVVLTKKKR